MALVKRNLKSFCFVVLRYQCTRLFLNLFSAFQIALGEKKGVAENIRQNPAMSDIGFYIGLSSLGVSCYIFNGDWLHINVLLASIYLEYLI